MVVASLFEPTGVVTESHTQQRSLPVLIDVSESMSLNDPRKNAQDIADAAIALGMVNGDETEADRIATRRKPLIAAVHGAALAGGFELALACDMIVAEEGCRFGVPEVIRGLVAGAGGALRLASMIPPARAREIILTGRMFDTEEAWDLGLIARRAAAGEGVATALALAREIAANAPLAVTESLRLSRAAERAQLAELWPENARTLRAILASEDAKEGAKAFLERRAPQWQGR